MSQRKLTNDLCVFRFALNLKESEMRTFFHISARLVTKEVVRNTLFGRWGKEEKSISTPFPFQYNVPFQVTYYQHIFTFRLLLFDKF